ncbi:CDP-diacylglycerol--glycerol-3-phosphate 3-phosphatidyltransferase [Agilicoccus flavus]|uniref:CDP-diacylglycerol--glycerol-3-phosphate 3-phosphatidyltransferase n=1 Tax=Agilicoccus flavus TaxID=2775968 RepID=UPI001CF63897|nr:CDP-diacylglycerol--glycerol-3-phosphate 3-phosphatidyltransferase [Agilicoccus flavus]
MSTAGPGEPTATPANATASNWNIANALTVLRIALVPVFGWLLLADGGHEAPLRWWAAVVFVLAMATDRLDGQLARSRNLITDFGKLADPIADKALTGMAFIGLSIVGDLWWWVTVLVLVREIGVTLLRFVVIRHGVMPASRGGKLKTVLQAVALTMFLVPLGGWWAALAIAAMAAAVLVTVVTGVDYVLAARRLVAAPSRTPDSDAHGTAGPR